VSTEGSKIKVPTLADLIERRDDLKIKLDLQRKQHHDPVRHELNQCVGAITELLHRPFKIESDRLTQRRQEIAAELEAAQHQRTQLRCRLGQAQGQRIDILTQGHDASDHLVSSKALSLDLYDCEERIGELEHRARGVDSQISALIEAEGVAMISGVSAT
jgi:chromosome segregation ATPase